MPPVSKSPTVPPFIEQIQTGLSFEKGKRAVSVPDPPPHKIQQVDSAPHSRLVEYVRNMIAHRIHAERQLLRNLLIGIAFADKSYYFLLPVSNMIERKINGRTVLLLFLVHDFLLLAEFPADREKQEYKDDYGICKYDDLRCDAPYIVNEETCHYEGKQAQADYHNREDHVPDIPVLYSLPVPEHDKQTESYHEQADQEAQRAQDDTVNDKVCNAYPYENKRTYEPSICIAGCCIPAARMTERTRNP